jgi:fructose-1,6-bisphosphatase/inositol monophosphatase family enzyme
MVDPDLVAQIVAETATDEIMPRFRQLNSGDVRDKSPGDVVTVADEAAERVLARRLSDLLPGSKVVGEEAAAADPGVLDLLSGDDPVWIVDPIDGTTNFAAGLPLFAVIVGLAQAGRMRLACLHDPIHGHMALACDGDGATLDGRPIEVAAPTEPARMTGVVKLRFGDRALPLRIVERCQRVPPFMDLRCAGHEYLALASGRLHYALYRKLMPWDHAAGQLLHREAGGFSRHLDRGPYRVDGPTATDGFMLAPDQASWQAIYDTLIADD